jgi:hypothetical protein
VIPFAVKNTYPGILQKHKTLFIKYLKMMFWHIALVERFFNT